MTSRATWAFQLTVAQARLGKQLSRGLDGTASTLQWDSMDS